MKIFFALIAFSGVLSSVWGDVDESSPLYRDLLKILGKGKDGEASCTKEPDNQAPWIFYSSKFSDLAKSENDPWFKVYEMEESTMPTLNRLRNIFPRPKEFAVQQDVLREHFDELTNKVCSDFKDCSKEKILQDVMQYKESFDGRKIALFQDVWVDSRGLIVNRQTCKAVRNGACVPLEAKFEQYRLDQKSYPLVISLATSWKSTWHWPMENIVALAHIDAKILATAVFHVPVATPYISSWLMALNIPSERIVTGTVTCQALLIPQMRCGNPYFSQLEWMREAYMPLETAAQRAAVGFAYSANSTIHAVEVKKEITYSNDAPLTLLLVERTEKRPVKNMNEVHSFAEAFARDNKMKLLVHSDRNMPPLQYQMRQFAEADIVLAPHGAGLMFATFLPYTSCVVEFSQRSNPLWYAHIAMSRNLSYVRVDMEENVMDLADAKVSLNRCMRAVVATKQERLGGVTSLDLDTASENSGEEKKSALVEGITSIVQSDSVVKDVLTTLSNFIP